MSRTKKLQRPPGYEYWTSRGGKRHGEEPGPFTKRETHRYERRMSLSITLAELADSRAEPVGG